MSYGFSPVYCYQPKQKDHTGAIAATTALGSGAGVAYSQTLLKKDPISQAKIYSALQPDDWIKGFSESIDLEAAKTAHGAGIINDAELDAIKKASERLGQYAANPINAETIPLFEGEQFAKLNEVITKVVNFFRNTYNRFQISNAENTLKEAYAGISPELKKKLADNKIIDAEKEAKVVAQMAEQRSAVFMNKLKFHGPKAAIGAAVGLAVALILNDFSRN